MSDRATRAAANIEKFVVAIEGPREYQRARRKKLRQAIRAEFADLEEAARRVCDAGSQPLTEMDWDDMTKLKQELDAMAKLLEDEG